MKAPLFLLTLLLILLLNPISAVDFVFNGFDDSPSHLSLFGNATIESKVLTLTNQTSYSTGRALYNTTIRTKDPTTSSVLPFSTSFIFAMAPSKNAVLSGHGLVFLFAPLAVAVLPRPQAHNLAGTGNPARDETGTLRGFGLAAGRGLLRRFVVIAAPHVRHDHEICRLDELDVLGALESADRAERAPGFARPPVGAAAASGGARQGYR